MPISPFRRQVAQNGVALLLGLAVIVSTAIVPLTSASTPSVQVLSGDWNGDGHDSPGIFADGVFTLWSATSSGGMLKFRYGRAGDVAVAGDWTGNGQDTVGVVRNGRHWHIRKSNSGGPADHVFTYGSRFGRNLPVPGDWNGDGFDTPGVVRGNTWLLRNSLSGGNADVRFRFGRARGDVYLAGDWSGQGKDLPGVVRDGVWHLRFAQAGGSADRSFAYGRADDAPVVGNWNGRLGDTPGAVRDGTWFLRNRLGGGSADLVLASVATLPDPGATTEEPRESLETTPGREKEPVPEPSDEGPVEPGPAPTDEQEAAGKVPPSEEVPPSEQSASDDLETKPAARPEELSWGSVWGTGEFETILGWYERNAGLSDPSVLGGVTTSQVVSTRDGQVIENLDIRYAGRDNKAIWVRHNDVVVRNNRVYADGSRNVIWVDAGLKGVVIEYNELDGSSPTYGTGRSDGNWGNIGIATRGPVEVIRGNRITGVRQGAALYPNTVVELNHVTGLHSNASGVSTSSFGHLGAGWGYAGGTVIRRNLVESGTSGAITVYSQSAGPARDALFQENLVVGVGRGMGIRGGHSGENRHDLRGIRIEGNRFHGTFGFPDELGQGTNAAVNLDKPGTTFRDNRWLGSTTDLPPRCGTTRDTCE